MLWEDTVWSSENFCNHQLRKAAEGAPDVDLEYGELSYHLVIIEIT